MIDEGWDYHAYYPVLAFFCPGDLTDKKAVERKALNRYNLIRASVLDCDH